MTYAADQARRRAHRLRSIAMRIEHTPVMRLEQFAGGDTWTGPSPELCRTTLRTNLAQLHRVADDLRWQAWLFDQRGNALELASALAGA